MVSWACTSRREAAGLGDVIPAVQHHSPYFPFRNEASWKPKDLLANRPAQHLSLAEARLQEPLGGRGGFGRARWDPEQPSRPRGCEAAPLHANSPHEMAAGLWHSAGAPKSLQGRVVRMGKSRATGWAPPLPHPIE